MNQKIHALTLAAALGFLILAGSGFAQGTAFTYQGRLQSGTNLATGAYDMTFTLFATDTGGGAIAGPVTNSAVGVSNGLFTTTVDFGAVFTPGRRADFFSPFPLTPETNRWGNTLGVIGRLRPGGVRFRGDVWTCARVARVIEEEFGVHYHKGHVSRLLRELKWMSKSDYCSRNH